ncbi:MAG: protoheme IX farnesyltransferase [Verrucomicrobiales bacterium]|nr:protoheme IX farnesyltransferase [Verrucomicrobiales bacterium]
MSEETQTAETSDAASGSLKGFREDLMALTKARLSLLVVLTTLFGYLVAARTTGDFSWATVLHTLLGTILAAAGSAVFNQLMEVEPDSRMKRTSSRPLPSNRMPKPMAFIMGWLLCAFGIIHLGMKVNFTATSMAAATLLTYLFIYTPMKRTSSFNTIVGGVSGALPPLIGWAAGDQSLWSVGALFLFALLFLWQMPHFAAINWMYREEYTNGGFKMWSNNDETGRKTARIAIFFSVLTFLLGVLFPLLTPIMSWWGAIGGGFLGLWMLWLSVKFLKSGDRKDARTLFFFTLLYLPLMMIVSYFAWVKAG